MYRIIGADGREYGPMSLEDLRNRLTEGRANNQTKARREDATEWQPLGTFPEFSASDSPSAPQPPGKPSTPRFMRVFSIVNIVAGCLGLIDVPFLFFRTAMSLQYADVSQLIWYWAVLRALWQILWIAVLLASGLGLWKLEPWARVLVTRLAPVAIAMGLADIVFQLMLFDDARPAERAQMAEILPGLLMVRALSFLYYIILIVFLNKSAAKQATGEVS